MKTIIIIVDATAAGLAAKINTELTKDPNAFLVGQPTLTVDAGSVDVWYVTIQSLIS